MEQQAKEDKVSQEILAQLKQAPQD